MPPVKLHRPEVADVFRTPQREFRARWNRVLSPQQRKAFRDIRDSRTARLGGHLQQCDPCGHRVILFVTPAATGTALSARIWLVPAAQRETELLAPYFHVVFTLPQQISRLALQNAKQLCSILFRTAAATLTARRHTAGSRFRSPVARRGWNRNGGTRIVDGPGQANLALALARAVPVRAVREHGMLQIRGEFFNALSQGGQFRPEPSSLISEPSRMNARVKL